MKTSGSWDHSRQPSLLAPARWARFALVGVAAASIASASLGQAKPEAVTEDGIIAGTMNIDFATRTSRDSSGRS